MILTIPTVVHHLHTKDDTFREFFLVIWPTLRSEVESLKRDPGCQCSLKVSAFLQADPQLAEHLSYVYREPVTVSLPRMISGEARIIEDSPEAYTAMTNELRERGERFVGMSATRYNDHQMILYFY